MYQIWLDWIRYPVAPANIDTAIPNKNYTHELINGEEITVVNKPGPTEFKFDLELPNTKYPWAYYDYEYKRNDYYEKDFKTSDYYLEKLYQAKNDKRYISMLIFRFNQKDSIIFTSMFFVTIEDMDIKEDAENSTDITVSLTLKVFIPSTVFVTKNKKKKTDALESFKLFNSSAQQSEAIGSTFNIGSAVSTVNQIIKEEKRNTIASIPNISDTISNITKSIYNSKEFDTLTKIAKEIFDDTEKWIDIYEENKAIIDSYASQYGLSKYSIVPNLPLRIPNMPIGVKRWLTN